MKSITASPFCRCPDYLCLCLNRHRCLHITMPERPPSMLGTQNRQICVVKSLIRRSMPMYLTSANSSFHCFRFSASIRRYFIFVAVPSSCLGNRAACSCAEVVTESQVCSTGCSTTLDGFSGVKTSRLRRRRRILHRRESFAQSAKQGPLMQISGTVTAFSDGSQ